LVALNVVKQVGTGGMRRQDLLNLRSAFTDGIHTLVRTKVHRHDSCLNVVSSKAVQADIDVTFRYTLTIYSALDFYLEDPLARFPYSKKVDGSFTVKTCGGNAIHRTFHRNPQYLLCIIPPHSPSGPTIPAVSLRITLETSRNIPVNVALVWGNGQRVTDLKQGDIRLDTGPYAYGIVTTEGTAKPGNYTLIVSTFEPGHTGDYALSVDCDAPLTLEPIDQEGAGMFGKVIKGKWQGTSASGNASLGRVCLDRLSVSASASSKQTRGMVHRRGRS